MQYPNMVCVEAGYVSQKYDLSAGGTFSASQAIHVSKLWQIQTYLSLDSRE